MTEMVVASFYRFVHLEDVEQLCQPLRACCEAHQVKGTILLATEGINGTVAGSRHGVDHVLSFLRTDKRLSNLPHKETLSKQAPFHRLKIKLKREIVTMGVPEADPQNLVGTYLDAAEWNAMLADPDAIVIDARNEYEISIGSFPGAVSPQTGSFREFPDFVEQQLADKKDRKIAMFCTGGIRCEKATSYLRSLGFEKVFHLQGGILRYLETVSAEDNQWQGDCFVFDDRVAVDKQLQVSGHQMCRACRRPLTDEDCKSPHYEEGVSCPYCYPRLSEEQRRSFAERIRQVRLAEARGERHIGVPMKKK